jgi:hypothetical protein
VNPERDTPGRERPSAWGQPAPVYESRDLSPDGSAGLDPHESPPEMAYSNPDGNTRSTGDLTANETTGQSMISTRQPLSSNGSRAAGDGRAFAQAWPLGGGHATVTKREHRILRGVRSGVVLAVIALAFGVATAASLGVIVWLIATAIHHAASN